MCFPSCRVVACAVPSISLSPYRTNAIASGSFPRHFISAALGVRRQMMGEIALLTSAAPHVTFISHYLVTNWNVSACPDSVYTMTCMQLLVALLHTFPSLAWFSLFTVEQHTSSESVSFPLKTFHFSFTDPHHSQQDQGAEKSPEFFCKPYTMWFMHLIPNMYRYTNYQY